jgi:hypothetical protein
MSLILFFGFTTFVVIGGLLFSGLVIRHHWKKNQELKKKAAEMIAPSAT